MKQEHYSDSSNCPEPIRPVYNAMNMLNEVVNRIHVRIDVLENRLEPVLSPEAQVKQDGAQCTSASKLDGEIRGQSARIDSAADRIERLIDRLTI